MKSDKKMMVIIVSILLLIILLLGWLITQKKSNAGKGKYQTESEEIVKSPDLFDKNNKENVKIVDNNKVNNSRAVKRKHQEENYTCENMKLYQHKDQTCAEFKITNNSDYEWNENMPLAVELYDKNGRVIMIMEFLAPNIKTNESKKMKVCKGNDFTNAYDYKIGGFSNNSDV